MFDYSGMSERKLARQCSRFFAQLPLCGVPYWASGLYSIGRCFKEYANLPQETPLFVFSRHGVSTRTAINHLEYENAAEAMLVFKADDVESYKRVSDKPCYQVTMPYVHHRRLHNITQSPDAKGTLVFPLHSTSDIDVIFDIDKYAAQLRALPPEFHPVCVSLHMCDIHKGLHREFMKRGFPVYSAGYTSDIFFIDRLYSYLRHFKYTVSNAVDSYTYYSVEMSIPFSCFGDEGESINIGNPCAPLGRMEIDDKQGYKEETDAFSGLHTQITPRQKELTERVLGIGQGLSGDELRQVLLDAYHKRGNPAKEARRVFKRRVKYGFTQLAAKALERIFP